MIFVQVPAWLFWGLEGNACSDPTGLTMLAPNTHFICLHSSARWRWSRRRRRCGEFAGEWRPLTVSPSLPSWCARTKQPQHCKNCAAVLYSQALTTRAMLADVTRFPHSSTCLPLYRVVLEHTHKTSAVATGELDASRTPDNTL